MITYAQVISDDDAGAYNEAEAYTVPVRPRKHGEIRIRLKANNAQPASETYALPLFPNTCSIPVIGELVVLVQLPSGDTTTKYTTGIYYYLSSLNVHSLRNLNQLPWMFDTVAGRSNIARLSTSGEAKLPKTYNLVEKTVPNLQPYEGDIIHQDRFGSSIRFTSSIPDSVRTESGKNVYNQRAPWTGPAGDPLLIFTTGIATSAQYYGIEDINNDNTSIYMTTSQKIKLNTSRPNIGRTLTPVQNYTQPQLILNSDRVIINSKQDAIVLSGNTTVTVATQNWATDMDTFFSTVESLNNEVSSLRDQVQSLTQQLTNLTAVISTYASAQATTTAAVPVLAPLTAINATLITQLTPITAGVATVTTQLLSIQTNLLKVNNTLINLKQ
jgi:hypothetical protein